MQKAYKEEAYAGFFVRLAAYAIDMFLVGFVLAFLKIPVWCARLFLSEIFLFQDILFHFDFFDILFYLLTAAYFIVSTYLYGATPGKYLMKIKVVSTQEERLSWTTVILRETIGRYLSAVVLYLGYFLIGIDRRKQGLHDKIMDTFVVYRDAKEETIKIVSEDREWIHLND